ncbi:hypothetical protein OUZ56_004510 [Daphnia magna]|uniref:Synapsin n=1 Tax=Daphnia magna TaxID=35525 RepID=A0ABQ9YQ02_9CRUS|nr:hypothetical protein OUZ56_004510 [Daphnia magna]
MVAQDVGLKATVERVLRSGLIESCQRKLGTKSFGIGGELLRRAIKAKTVDMYSRRDRCNARITKYSDSIMKGQSGRNRMTGHHCSISRCILRAWSQKVLWIRHHLNKISVCFCLLFTFGADTSPLPHKRQEKQLVRTFEIVARVSPCKKSTKISFSSFKQSFTANVNNLKRRFSSGDLTEYDDANGDPQQLPQPPPPSTSAQVHQQQQPALPPRPVPASGPSSAAQPVPQPQQQQVGQAAAAAPQQPDLSLPLRSSSRTTSAPTSPAKSRESLLQRVSSLTSNVVGNVSRVASSQIQQQQQQTVETGKLSYNKDHCFTLLVIDDQNTDWSKYFRGRRIHGDWDVRVEQAEFRELSITASTDSGATVSMAVYRSGTKVVRAFRPDFVLIRQNMRDASEDYKSIVLGLKFGGVPSINSLEAVYHFQDKPWVFGHLLDLQRRFGRDQFPLINQTFYPNHREMVSHYLQYFKQPPYALDTIRR